jgi:hypothetical protein
MQFDCSMSTGIPEPDWAEVAAASHQGNRVPMFSIVITHACHFSEIEMAATSAR